MQSSGESVPIYGYFSLILKRITFNESGYNLTLHTSSVGTLALMTL